MGKKISLALLRFYKKWISPMLGIRCKFEPTCSVYMYMAIEKYGTSKGIWMGLKRLARCQPCSQGGYDPLP